MQQIASALDVIVQVARLGDGRRRLISVQRVGEVVDDRLELHSEFVFEAERDAHVRCAGAA